MKTLLRIGFSFLFPIPQHSRWLPTAACALLYLICSLHAWAQEGGGTLGHHHELEPSDSTRQENILLDSLYIEQVLHDLPNAKPKVLHAEPLFIDLIRDLGARKGEREWNVGFGFQDETKYDSYNL